MCVKNNCLVYKQSIRYGLSVNASLTVLIAINNFQKKHDIFFSTSHCHTNIPILKFKYIIHAKVVGLEPASLGYRPRALANKS